MKKSATTPETALAVTNGNTDLATNDAPSYPVWFTEQLDKRSGELVMKSKYKYLEGMPIEYRFDGRVGTFGKVNQGGLNKIKLAPIGYRLFNDDILGQKERKDWGEIFFIDETNAVAAILFHTHSLRNLMEIIAPLFYDDLYLEDVIITCTSTKMEAKKWNPETQKEDKFNYFLANFAFEVAPMEEVAERVAFANTVRLYRKQTTTSLAVYSEVHRYFNMYEVAPALEAGTGAEEVAEEGTGAEVEL